LAGTDDFLRGGGKQRKTCANPAAQVIIRISLLPVRDPI